MKNNILTTIKKDQKKLSRLIYLSRTGSQDSQTGTP